ncbi:hypothetical protein AOLI_G00085880 [Acnodon oligacanthus]
MCIVETRKSQVLEGMRQKLSEEVKPFQGVSRYCYPTYGNTVSQTHTQHQLTLRGQDILQHDVSQCARTHTITCCPKFQQEQDHV